MLKHELKTQLKMPVIYICFAAIAWMVFTQFIPRDWRQVVMPMKRANFIYFQLEKDVNAGVSDDAFLDYSYCAKAIYTDAQKELMREIMREMNPEGITDRAALAAMDFALTEEELTRRLNELAASVGVSYYHEGASNLVKMYINCLDISFMIIPEDKELLIERLMNTAANILEEGKGLAYEKWFFVEYGALTEEELAKYRFYYTQLEGIARSDAAAEERYDRLRAKLRELDLALGGDTVFSDANIEFILWETASYDKMVESYKATYGAESRGAVYGRYLSDYAGIIFGLLTPLAAAFVILREKRCRMEDAVYGLPFSSVRFVATRFLGIFIPLVVWLVVMYGMAAGIISYCAGKVGESTNVLAFIGYAFFWVLPSIVFFIGAQFVLSLLLDNEIIPLALCVLTAFYSLTHMDEQYDFWLPVIRFNYLGNYDAFRDNLGSMIVNRLFILAAGLLFTMLCVKLIENRRGGRAACAMCLSNASAIISSRR